MSRRYSGDADIRLDYGPVWRIEVARGRQREVVEIAPTPARAKTTHRRLLAQGVMPNSIVVTETLGYHGTVSDPTMHFQGAVPPARRFADPASSEAYDDAAVRLAALAQHWAKTRPLSPKQTRKLFEIETDGRGRPRLRRGYQAPCPVR